MSKNPLTQVTISVVAIMAALLSAPPDATAQPPQLHFTNNTQHSVYVSLFSRTERRWAVHRWFLAPNQQQSFAVTSTFTYTIFVALDGVQIPLGDFIPPRGAQNQVFPVALAMLFPTRQETAYSVPSVTAGYQPVSQPVSQPVQPAQFSLQWFPVVLSSTNALPSYAQNMTTNWHTMGRPVLPLTGW